MNEKLEHGWTVNGRTAPAIDTEAYLWWRRGLTDEHYAEIEGMSEAMVSLRELVTTLGQVRRDMTIPEVVRMLASIFGVEVMENGRGEHDPSGEVGPSGGSTA